MRPQSLHEVSLQVLNRKDFNMSMKEFLDEVKYRRATGNGTIASMCELEPRLTGVPMHDVFVAGVAELLLDKSVPSWTLGPDRFLLEPIIFGGKHSRAFTIQYTPVAMRKRLLFCGDIQV